MSVGRTFGFRVIVNLKYWYCEDSQWPVFSGYKCLYKITIVQILGLLGCQVFACFRVSFANVARSEKSGHVQSLCRKLASLAFFFNKEQNFNLHCFSVFSIFSACVVVCVCVCVCACVCACVWEREKESFLFTTRKTSFINNVLFVFFSVKGKVKGILSVCVA
jgi:hypothetical protein